MHWSGTARSTAADSFRPNHAVPRGTESTLRGRLGGERLTRAGGVPSPERPSTLGALALYHCRERRR